MKMTVKEFVKLDLTSLMQVNGGTSACGNYTQTQPATPPSGGNETDNAPSNNGGGTGESANTNDTPSSYSPGYSGGSTTGTTTGTCGGSGGQTPLENPPKTNDKPNNDTTNNNNNNGGSTSVGGCSSINGGNGNGNGAELKGKKAKEEDDVVANDLPTDSSTPPEQPTSPNTPTTGPSDGSTDNSTMENNGNNYEYQQTTNTNAPHCDIIAWNHAVDAGVDPTGEDGTVWDGNADGMNVNNIYNNYYAAGSTEFNSDLAGQSGYLFSDWRGDGSFDHMEYCTVNEDGSYTFYRNNGYENSEVLDTRFFSNDPNGQASSDGIVRFYSLTGDN